MQLKNSGKLITKINYKDKYTEIFFNDEKIKINSEGSIGLYENQFLTNAEINQVIEQSEFLDCLQYSLKLLSHKHYSINLLEEKLLLKFENIKIVKNVIKRLKELNLLDDNMLMLDTIEFLNEKNYGKLKILDHLNKMKINPSLINKVKFNDKEEIKKATNLFNKKKTNNYNPSSARLLLLSSGFEEDIVMKVISNKFKGDFIC